MKAYDLFDSRSFATKMDMALSILARKRPKPTQEEQGEAFQPILDHILAMTLTHGNATMAPAKPTEAIEVPLMPEERIVAQTADEVERANAGPLNDLLTKVQKRADEVKAPTFDIAFSREEGMFIQDLPRYLEAGGKFHVVENKGFNPQHGWVLKIGKK